VTDPSMMLAPEQAGALAELESHTGAPGFTLLVGAGGVGKTSLCHRLVSRHTGGRATLRSVRSGRTIEETLLDVHDELGLAKAGDLIVLDEFGDVRPLPSPEQVRELGLRPRWSKAHVVATSREAAATVMNARATSAAPFPPEWGGATGRVVRLAPSLAVFSNWMRSVDSVERAALIQHLLTSGELSPELNRWLTAQVRDSIDEVGPTLAVYLDRTGRLRVAGATALPSTQVDLQQGTSLHARPLVLIQRNRDLWLSSADELEELINDDTTSENDLQAFFEVNPHLLTRGDYKRAIAHPVLTRADGDLIPDFMLEPEDGFADILELKLPTARLTAGKPKRLRQAADLMSAVAQVREYSSYFDNDDARAAFEAKYGTRSYRPGATILIGRDPVASDPLELRRLWTEVQRDATIITYDELLRRVRTLGRF
jgi:hypothetical protein